MDSTGILWTLHGVYVESMWSLLGFYGVYMESTWIHGGMSDTAGFLPEKAEIWRLWREYLPGCPVIFAGLGLLWYGPGSYVIFLQEHIVITIYLSCKYYCGDNTQACKTIQYCLKWRLGDHQSWILLHRHPICFM